MAAVASPPPGRVLSGSTSDAPFQPLADCGYGNSAFYHTFFDDFDQAFGATTGNTYTVSKVGTGTLAQTAGDGGLYLFTTTGASGDVVSIQVVTASYTVNSQPKKVFFQCKFRLGTVATSTAIAGLCNVTATPFTAIADGIYFKWVGGTGLTINSAISSTTTSVTIPTAAYTMANATDIELAFYVNRNGDILAFVDTQLAGFVPQSNQGTPGNPQNAGPVARIAAPSLTTVNLTPTLGVQTNSAAAKTMTADFMGAYKER